VVRSGKTRRRGEGRKKKRWVCFLRSGGQGGCKGFKGFALMIFLFGLNEGAFFVFRCAISPGRYSFLTDLIYFEEGERK